MHHFEVFLPARVWSMKERKHYKTIRNRERLEITVPKHGCCSPAPCNHWRNGVLLSLKARCSSKTWSFNLDLRITSTNRGRALTVSSSWDSVIASAVWNKSFICFQRMFHITAELWKNRSFTPHNLQLFFFFFSILHLFLFPHHHHVVWHLLYLFKLSTTLYTRILTFCWVMNNFVTSCWAIIHFN